MAYSSSVNRMDGQNERVDRKGEGCNQTAEENIYLGRLHFVGTKN